MNFEIKERMDMSRNKIGKSIKAAGNGIASAARRVKSRFKRFTVKIGAHLTEQAVIKTLKHWVENSETTDKMTLKEIFRSGGPCDMMVLKTCIGSIKAKHSSSMVTAKEHFDTFNTKLYGENGNVTIVRTKCDAVLDAITNNKTPTQALDDLTKAFGVLTQKDWEIGSSGVKNPFYKNLVSVQKSIEGLIIGNNKTLVTTAINPSSSSTENRNVKYEKLGFADRLGVTVSKSKAEEILRKWTNNAKKARPEKTELKELFGRGKHCDINILLPCMSKLKPKNMPNFTNLCKVIAKKREEITYDQIKPFEGLCTNNQINGELKSALFDLFALLKSRTH